MQTTQFNILRAKTLIINMNKGCESLSFSKLLKIKLLFNEFLLDLPLHVHQTTLDS